MPGIDTSTGQKAADHLWLHPHTSWRRISYHPIVAQAAPGHDGGALEQAVIVPRLVNSVIRLTGPGGRKADGIGELDNGSDNRFVCCPTRRTCLASSVFAARVRLCSCSSANGFVGNLWEAAPPILPTL